MEGGPLGST